MSAYANNNANQEQSSLKDQKLLLVIMAALICVPVYSVDITLSILSSSINGVGGAANQAQLIIMTFLLSYAILQVPTGILSDRYGRRPILIIGIIAFILGGIITVISQDVNQLLLGRLIQGFGGAVGATLSRSICRDVSSGRAFNKNMSTMIAVLAFVSMSSPLIGSLLDLNFGWRAPYLSILIAGLILLVVIILFLPETNTHKQKDIKVSQQILSSFASLVQTPLAIWATMLLAIYFFGFMSLLSTFALVLESVYKISTFNIAIMISLGLLSYVFSSIIARRLSVTLGSRWLILFGACVIFVCSLLLIAIFFTLPVRLELLCLACMLYIFGFGLFFSSATTIYLDKLPRTAGFVSGIVGSFQIGAGSLGAYIASVIYDGTAFSIVSAVGICSTLFVLVYVAGVLLIPDARPHSLKRSQQT